MKYELANFSSVGRIATAHFPPQSGSQPARGVNSEICQNI